MPVDAPVEELKNLVLPIGHTKNQLGDYATDPQQNPGFDKLMVIMERTNASSAVAATGSITATGIATNNDVLVVNGITFTFKTSPAGAHQIGLGSSAANLAALILAALQAAPDAAVQLATYVLDTNPAKIDITDKTVGSGGNSFTLTTTEANLTLSGATLAGGTVPPTFSVYYEIYSPVNGDWKPLRILNANATLGVYYFFLTDGTAPSLTYPDSTTGVAMAVPLVGLWRLRVQPADPAAHYDAGFGVYYVL